MSTTPTPQPPPQPRSIAWVWWLLGIAGGFFLLLILGGLFLAHYVARGIRVERGGQHVEVRTPVGPFSLETSEVKDVGLPVYPGATPSERGKNVAFGVPAESQMVGISASRYRTPDPLEQVDTWYRSRLGPEFKRDAGDKEGNIQVRGVKAKGVAYVAENHDLVRIVALSKTGGGIEIALLRIGAREPQ